jgi:hypothetical protein
MPKTKADKKLSVVRSKRCPRCKKVKPTKTGFYPDKQNKTGYRTYCKSCLRKPKESKQKSTEAGNKPNTMAV